MSITRKSVPRTSRGRHAAVVGLVLAIAVAGAGTPALAQAPVVLPLHAVAGSTVLAGQAVTVWGYNTTNDPVTRPGGPTLTVTVGDQVTIELHNELAEASSLVVRGQPMPTDQVGVEAGGTGNYTFTPTEPGTYLYEAGPLANAQHQVAMGLYGALVVVPASGTPYDTDLGAVVLVSEIDPALNNAVNPAAVDLRGFHPTYSLINGTVYPDTPPVATVDAGQSLVLRYVNAGLSYHSMSLLGANQRIVADDGHALTHPTSVVAQTVGPGQTFDAVIDVPTNAAPGTMLSVLDANLQVRNRGRRPANATASAGYGGALAFIAIGGAPGAVDTGPIVTAVAATTTEVTATISDATTGNNDVVAAEYFIDSVGAAGTGSPFPVTAAPTVTVSATFTSPLSSGSHTVYVRGQDSNGIWGPTATASVSTDTAGPATTGLNLTPARTNGSVDVALHATGSDATSGGANVVAAEYTIDGGAPVGMTLNNVAVTASLDAVIAAPTVQALTPEGPHIVSVRAQDALGNWGSPTSITLVVDRTGPTTSGLTVAPSPSNGAIGVNSSTPAVRVTATATDTTSMLVRAEGFIDTVGTDNTGFLLVPTDGSWSSLTEAMRVDIPLSTIAALPDGEHTIHVHAKDVAGNWGPTSPVILLVDKTRPAVTAITAPDPTPITGPAVHFAVTFSEPVTGVASSNFALTQGGGQTGATITSVTGSGTTWTVTAAIGTGGGTLGLNFTAGSGIKDAAGNQPTAVGLPVVGPAYTLPSSSVYFSTFGNSNPPGVTGTADDADIYLWNGTIFSRSIDVSTPPYSLPASGGGNANVDGFDRVDPTHFYVSFTGQVNVPGIGNVQDEDVVYFNAGTWSLFFDGSVRGVGATDLDAISIVSGSLFFSTDNTFVPPGAGGGGDDADIYRWNGLSSYTRMIDASVVGWSVANVDGMNWQDATHVDLSYSVDTTVPGLGAVQDEDIVRFTTGTWSVYFDGTAKGLTSNNLDIDAFDLP